MDEKINLNEFDLLGIIKLKDVKGIEKFVTPIEGSEEYFSRSKEYYNVHDLAHLSKTREYLKNLLDRRITKRNFVILENMLNCSGRSYFRLLEESLRNTDSVASKIDFIAAKRCLEEDVKNIIVVLSSKGLISINPNNVLPSLDINVAQRSIEMDNKALLYQFAKSLEIDDKNTEILTPGYGALYIGPFLKELYGCDYTNIIKSKYIKDLNIFKGESDPRKLVSSQRIFDNNRNVILLDDNVGTGTTINELKESLSSRGVNISKAGAIQFNWKNFLRVGTGEKKDIDRFDISNFDIITPMNYAGHKLYEHAIGALLYSGKGYEEYLNDKQYRNPECSDLAGTIYRGIYCASKAGLNLPGKDIIPKEYWDSSEKYEVLPQYKIDESKCINKNAQGLWNKVLGFVDKNKEKKQENILIIND